jgi:hypothetical protein
MPIIGGIESEANQLIQRNAERDATVTGNLRNWGAQSGDVYNRQIGTGHQMRADALGRLESEIMRAISENNLSGAEQTSDMHDRLAEMLGERGAYLAEQVNNLSAQEFEQAFKQAQLDLQAQEMADRRSQAQAELSLRAQGMADERDARARSGELTEKEKLAMQLEAWGMSQDQANTDRAYGLDVQKFKKAGEPTPAELYGILSSMVNTDPLAGPVGQVNPALKEMAYQAGVIDRPPPSGLSRMGRGLSGGWGGSSGGSRLATAAQSRTGTAPRDSLSSLRRLYSDTGGR